VLGRAGFWGSAGPRLAILFRFGTWFLAAVSVLAALVNFASQSRWEKLIFGPWRCPRDPLHARRCGWQR
jgi:hypothetical protein